MKDTQKRFLGAVLAASSVVGVVAPSVTAMATVVDDESKATAEDLKNVIAEYSTKLEANPIFANYHRVQYAAERLAQYDAAASEAAKASIAKYADKVFTAEVTAVLDKMNEFANGKSMANYDALVTKEIKAMTNQEDAAYLMSRLDVWGKAIVFEVDPNYVVATDAIIKVADLRKAGKLDEAQTQADVAKKAIKEIKTYAVNGAYLEAALKVESDAVENEMANQDLHVTSVVAKNGREIEVKFNKAVSKDSAEKVANYTFASANSDAKTVAVKADGAELQDDNKTVILTLVDGSTLNNKTNAKYLVKVQDVVTDEDKNMDDFSQIIALFDNVKPEVTGLEYTDSDTVRINFSEPINVADRDAAASTVKVKLNGATVSVKSTAFKLDDDKMYLEMSKSAANLEDDKTYSIEIDGLTDYASNALTKFTSDISFKKDDVDPTVEKIEALSKKVFKVTFSEKVTKKDDADLNGKGVFTVSGTTRNVAKIEHNEDGNDRDYKTFIVTLDSEKDGNDIITIGAFTDLAGNKGDSLTQEIKFEKTHPVLESTTPAYKTIDGKKYAVYSFDRDVQVGAKATVEVKHMDNDGVTKTNNVNIFGSKEVVGAAHTLLKDQLDENEIALAIDTDVIPAVTIEEGKYTFDFETSNVKDTYDQDIEKTSLGFTKSANGAKAEVTTFTTNTQVGTDQSKKNKVKVVFNQDLTASALDASKYTVDGVPVFEKAELKDNKQTLELTLKEGAIKISGQKMFAITGVDGVKDFNDNKIDAGHTITFVENERPVVDKAEVISYNTIKLTMSEVVKDFVGNPLEVKINGNKVTKPIIVKGKDTDTLTITLDAADELRNSNDKVTIDVLESDAINSIADAVGNNAEKTTINAEVKLDTLLADAIKAVEAYEASTGSLANAQAAVNKLKDNSADKINLQARIDAATAKVEVAKAKAKADLVTAISEAQKAHDDAAVVEGKVAGNTVEGSKATLKTAIDTAQAVVDAQASTTQQFTDAKTPLGTAVDTFKAAKVEDITAKLVAPAAFSMAGTKTGSITITDYVAANGETLNVTSATTTDVTVDDATKLAVTGVKQGSSVITVQVKDAAGHVIKTGTVTVTVNA